MTNLKSYMLSWLYLLAVSVLVIYSLVRTPLIGLPVLPFLAVGGLIALTAIVRHGAVGAWDRHFGGSYTNAVTVADYVKATAATLPALFALLAPVLPSKADAASARRRFAAYYHVRGPKAFALEARHHIRQATGAYAVWALFLAIQAALFLVEPSVQRFGVLALLVPLTVCVYLYVGAVLAADRAGMHFSNPGHLVALAFSQNAYLFFPSFQHYKSLGARHE